MTAPENEAFREQIEEIAADFAGATRTAIVDAAGELAEFLVFLRSENETTNLVSKKAADPEELVNRHLADSLLALDFLPRPSPGTRLRLLDIGSGGGFPAIPILIVRREIDATLVESTAKKAAFLRAASRRLALTAEVLNVRFPDSFPMKNTARFDILTTRAVASAGRLVHLAQPVLKSSARAILWTSEPLFRHIASDGGARKSQFFPAPGAERRGLAILESFT